MMALFFRGDDYNDDRLFVLYLGKCTVEDGEGGTVATTIFHDSEPSVYKWCIVTYRNTLRYPAVKVDHFDSLEAARRYLEQIEPTVPLISLGGEPPTVPLSYDKYLAWKVANQVKDYDYRSVYSPGGENHRETMISPKR